MIGVEIHLRTLERRSQFVDARVLLEGGFGAKSFAALFVVANKRLGIPMHVEMHFQLSLALKVLAARRIRARVSIFLPGSALFGFIDSHIALLLIVQTTSVFDKDNY